jgi:hypothetical protein
VRPPAWNQQIKNPFRSLPCSPRRARFLATCHACFAAAEQFEHAYNFRFEEPGAFNIITHPRNVSFEA